MQQAKMNHAYCVSINPGWKKMQFQVALNKTLLGPPVLESSAWISKFYAPTDPEHKFNKTKIENWPSIGYNLGPP